MEQQRHHQRNKHQIQLSEMGGYLLVLLIGLGLGFGYLWFLNGQNGIEDTLNDPPQSQTSTQIPGR